MRLHVSDKNLDEVLHIFAKYSISAPVYLRIDTRKMNGRLERIKAKVAKMLNVNPDTVKIFEKYAIVADFVFICEDAACSKTKPKPLCTLDGFALLKALLEFRCDYD